MDNTSIFAIRARAVEAARACSGMHLDSTDGKASLIILNIDPSSRAIAMKFLDEKSLNYTVRCKADKASGDAESIVVPYTNEPGICFTFVTGSLAPFTLHV